MTGQGLVILPASSWPRSSSCTFLSTTRPTPHGPWGPPWPEVSDGLPVLPLPHRRHLQPFCSNQYRKEGKQTLAMFVFPSLSP